MKKFDDNNSELIIEEKLNPILEDKLARPEPVEVPAELLGGLAVAARASVKQELLNRGLPGISL